MEIINVTYDTLQEKRQLIHEPLAATIGMFDGLHLGHQALIDKVLGSSEKKALISFSTALLEKKNHQLTYLLSEEDKEAKLEAMGFDYFIVIDFTPAIMGMDHEVFVADLFSVFPIKQLVVGEDFFFGKDRKGSAQTLATATDSYGFELDVIKIVKDTEEIISSSNIKKAILAGDFVIANKHLGYAYTIQGEVIHGAKRGRVLGFPTINMSGEMNYYLPSAGVYITTTNIDGKVYQSITSVGVAPTVGDDLPVVVETFILDYSGDLYGKIIPVSFYKKLRNEENFASLEALVDQMNIDKANTRKYFE